ncbi:MAG TPA: DUF3109 domain-containing protein [Bacteroidales bacterium]|nr:DUF3109 domain-containing protein [Bacteroidales bacterium]
MIIIGSTLISEEIYTEQFACDLSVCKGACCIEGDAGAPLAADELPILQEIFPKLKPYLSEQNYDVLTNTGLWVPDAEGLPVTPLINAGDCAYVYYDEHDTAKCAIEKAWLEREIDFQKPVSCHLYPIRISKFPDYDALNYHCWHICRAAVKKGRKLKVRMFRFLKDALIRKYGQEWYDELDAFVKLSLEQN